MNPSVDEYISDAKRWKKVMQQLQKISLDCELTESLKWGKPCYSFQGNNIAIIQPFKESCGYMFFKGTLLEDPENILEKPGKHSRIARRILFTGVQETIDMESLLKSYIKGAIKVEKEELEVDLEVQTEPTPKEFQEKLDKNPELKTAFNSLTPGRQRGYILYFSGAKQSTTRKRRVEKYVDKILNGKGLRE